MSTELVLPQDYNFHAIGDAGPAPPKCAECLINIAEWIVFNTALCTDCRNLRLSLPDIEPNTHTH